VLLPLCTPHLLLAPLAAHTVPHVPFAFAWIAPIFCAPFFLDSPHYFFRAWLPDCRLAPASTLNTVARSVRSFYCHAASIRCCTRTVPPFLPVPLCRRLPATLPRAPPHAAMLVCRFSLRPHCLRRLLSRRATWNHLRCAEWITATAARILPHLTLSFSFLCRSLLSPALPHVIPRSHAHVSPLPLAVPAVLLDFTLGCLACGGRAAPHAFHICALLHLCALSLFCRARHALRAPASRACVAALRLCLLRRAYAHAHNFPAHHAPLLRCALAPVHSGLDA